MHDAEEKVIKYKPAVPSSNLTVALLMAIHHGVSLCTLASNTAAGI